MGDCCKVCYIVWNQGGYEAEYGTEDRFVRCCDSNPTLLHSFLEKRTQVVKMKRADPHCRFRVELNVGPLQSLSTSKASTQGLEAPEVHFVELSEYEKEYGAAQPDEIISELVGDKYIQGVNVLTGKKGWHKRVNVTTTQVKRTAEFSDGVVIDDGSGLEKMEAAIKKATLKTIKPTQVATASIGFSQPSCAAMSDGAPAASMSSHPDANGGEAEPIDIDDTQHSESEDELPTGLSSFLKTFAGPKSADGASSSTPTAKAKPVARAPKPKSAPRPKSIAKGSSAPASTGTTSKGQDKGDKRIAIGTAGATGASKRQRVAEAGSDGFADDVMTSPSARANNTESSDDITEADQSTLATFEQKIDPLKHVNPPDSDGPYKTHVTDHLSKMAQVIQELKVKKKSADRRAGSKNNKADMLFLQRLGQLETELKDMHKLVRCLAGQVTLDADKTLLACLDDASAKYNMAFNHAVIRKALKQLIYDDLKLCKFDHMAGDTYELVASRFVAEEGDDNVTCETFYAMCCGQVLQKLAKNTQSKVRSKESIFTPHNKKEMNLIEQFFTSLAASSKIPAFVANDAQDLMKLIRADVDSASAVRAAIDRVTAANTSADPERGLTAMLLGSNVGIKLLSDATRALEDRCVDTEMTAKLEDVFAKLPTTYTTMSDETSAKDMCDGLQEAHNILSDFLKDKARVRSLGKDGASKMQGSLRTAATILVMHSTLHEVRAWLDASSLSMRETGLISELACPQTQSLMKLQDYMALKTLITTSSGLSKSLLAIKSNTANGTGPSFNECLEKFDKAVVQLKDFFHKSSLKDTLPTELNTVLNDLSTFVGTQFAFLEKLNEQGLASILKSILSSVQAMCGGGDSMSDEIIDKAKKDIEQAKLIAAALPNDSIKRVPVLQATEFLDGFSSLAGALHKWTHSVDSNTDNKSKDAVMNHLVVSNKKLRGYQTKLDETIKLVVNMFETELQRATDLPSTDTLGIKTHSMFEAFAAAESSWTRTIASQIEQLVEKFGTYNIPNVKGIEYTVGDNNTLPTMDEHFPSLKDLNEAQIVHDVHLLQQYTERVKDVGLDDHLTCYSQAVSIYSNAMTALAIIALVKVLQLKRFKRAVEGSAQIPAQLIASLNETMRTCKETSPPLEVPPALQAQVSYFVNWKPQ